MHRYICTIYLYMFVYIYIFMYVYICMITESFVMKMIFVCAQMQVLK